MSYDFKRYKKLTDAIRETLEDCEATYGEAFEALDGVKNQLEIKLHGVRIDLPEGK